MYETLRPPATPPRAYLHDISGVRGPFALHAQQIGISQMHVSRLIRRSLEKVRQEISTDGDEEPSRRTTAGANPR